MLQVMRCLKPSDSRQELRSTKVVSRMSLLEGWRKGYSNDIPAEFHGRIGEEIRCDFRTERSA